MNFGPKSPKLNSRLVYCSRLYGNYFYIQPLFTVAKVVILVIGFIVEKHKKLARIIFQVEDESWGT